jgi:hypothetical protein
MRIISNYLFFPVITVLVLACGSSEILNNNKNFKEADNKNTAYLLNLVEKCGDKSPRTVNANFDIEGHSESKSFKASGNLRFNANSRKVRIIFHDAVFKSPITEIIQDEDIIKIFFPFDKILYIDNVKTINLRSYSSLELDFNLVSCLSYGRIPVIKNFSVVKGLESGAGSGSSDNKFIILENNDYYETISFKLDTVDKILWMNKDTRKKIEVYFDKPVGGEDILFYKSVRIFSLKNDFKITINFNDIKFNIPVDVENMLKLDLSKDIKVILKN